MLRRSTFERGADISLANGRKAAVVYSVALYPADRKTLMREQMQIENAASIRAVVMSEMQKIAEEHHKDLVSLSDKTALSSCGLDSLCFAVLVARLEDRFRVDPFSTSEDGAFPATLGEFVRMYENAAK